MNNLVFNTISNPLNVKLTDGSTSVTVMNDALETIDIVHAEIHEGEHYTASHFYQAVANASYADLHIVTGSTKYTHTMIIVQSEAKAYVNFYTGSTYTGGNGTAVTVFNNNENSTNTTASSVYYTPTIATTGTLILQDFVPAGTGSRAIGGNVSSRNEWILKPSTDHLIRVQNVGGSSVTSDITITLMYYEISV